MTVEYKFSKIVKTLKKSFPWLSYVTVVASYKVILFELYDDRCLLFGKFCLPFPATLIYYLFYKHMFYGPYLKLIEDRLLTQNRRV